MANNPYASPESASDPHTAPPPAKGSVRRQLGSVIFALGLLTTLYGATAFWLVKTLPPNGGPSGRLPSLYLLAVGMGAMLLGLAIRNLQVKKRR